MYTVEPISGFTFCTYCIRQCVIQYILIRQYHICLQLVLTLYSMYIQALLKSYNNFTKKCLSKATFGQTKHQKWEILPLLSSELAFDPF